MKNRGAAKMIITDYYKFEKLGLTKSKTRYDCTASTQSYAELEILKNAKGELFIYFNNVPDSFKATAQRRADKIITNRLGQSISSVFVPNVEKPFAFGDFRNSNDLFLIEFSHDYLMIDIFVCRGQLNNRNGVFNLFADGELTAEVEAIKNRAVTDLVTKEK